MARKRAALYARVSTSGQSVDAQLHALRKYARRRRVDAKTYADQGVSGAKGTRPALDKLMAAARRREVDLVVCTKLDRLARSTVHLGSLSEELKVLGVDLVVLDMAMDTSTPAGKLLFDLLGAIAEFERALILERIHDGIAAARRKGVRLGRPPKLDRRQRARVMRLWKSGEGRSVRAIARQLDDSVASILRRLDRWEEAGIAPLQR